MNTRAVTGRSSHLTVMLAMRLGAVPPVGGLRRQQPAVELDGGHVRVGEHGVEGRLGHEGFGVRHLDAGREAVRGAVAQREIAR